jgi:hypothetical protein
MTLAFWPEQLLLLHVCETSTNTAAAIFKKGVGKERHEQKYREQKKEKAGKEGKKGEKKMKPVKESNE